MKKKLQVNLPECFARWERQKSWQNSVVEAARNRVERLKAIVPEIRLSTGRCRIIG